MQRTAWIVGVCFALLLAGLLVTPSPTLAESEATGHTYKIDPAHAGFYFRIEHMGLSHTMGRFNTFSGDFTLDGAESTFELTIETDSIDTGWKKRDDHLRSPDFFNVKQFPEITFTSTEVQREGDVYEVTGELTMLGTTRTVTVPLTKLGEGEDPWGNQRVGFDSTLTIERSDFGMTKFVDNGMVGDEVEIMISFEGIRQ